MPSELKVLKVLKMGCSNAVLKVLKEMSGAKSAAKNAPLELGRAVTGAVA